MADWKKVTLVSTGTSIWINLDRVNSLYRNKDAETEVTMLHSNEVWGKVSETPEQIFEM